MPPSETRETAEAVLRELPSVLGAAVREDIKGNPREVHILLAAGPSAGDFARDVRDLLEERLGIPVDQRVISVAQLATDAAWPEVGPRETRDLPLAAQGTAGTEPVDPRARVDALRTRLGEGRAMVEVRLEWDGALHDGEATEMEAGLGRVRAAARAALAAAEAACGGRVTLAVEGVAPVRAFERGYVLVTATAAAPFLGRRPLQLAGAQPVGPDGEEWAAAMAAFKAVNRVLARALRDAGAPASG